MFADTNARLVTTMLDRADDDFEEGTVAVGVGFGSVRSVISLHSIRIFFSRQTL